MFLNGRLLFNSSKISSSILIKSIRKSFIIQNSTFYSIQKKTEQKNTLNKNNYQKIIEYASKRRIVLGGPGYTNYGHGRYKVNLSKYAYFWYAFITGGFVFALFFDFEDFMLRGEEPIMKYEELQKFNKETITKAKSSNDDDVLSLDDNKNSLSKAKSKSYEEDVDEDSNEKKEKANSFRQRKV
jgi:hypothetical protein